MAHREDIVFEWQGKAVGIAIVWVDDPVWGWEAVDGSEGRQRNPAKEFLIEPYGYPWAGILTEVRAGGLRETFYAIDIAMEARANGLPETFEGTDIARVRAFVNKYDPGVRVLRDSGASLERGL